MSQLGVLAVMVSMAEEVPSLSIPHAVLGLARFMAKYHERLSDDQAADLLALGASLWRRGIELQDAAPDIDTSLSAKQ